MKNIQYKIERKLSLLVMFFIFILLGVQAQSNLTNTLGITSSDLLTTNSGPSTYSFSTVRTKLTAANADSFLITANYSPGDFPPIAVGGKISVYTFTLNSQLVYDIGVTNIGGDLRWYIRRPTGIAQISNSTNLDYEIYDDLGVNGNFTFILGHYFTAIAVDDGATNFKLAPVFFGMDSNIGSLSSHIGEITGETSLGYSRSVYIHRTSKTWKMSGDAKIATLISLLKSNNGNIENAKVANTKEAVLSVNEDENNLIKNLKLYPNPSDGKFNLGFSLKEESSVSFKIFNLSGQKVFEQNNNQFSKGNNKYVFDKAGKLSAGFYIVNVTSDEFSKSMKLIIE
jgi:hypothetical protein